MQNIFELSFRPKRHSSPSSPSPAQGGTQAVPQSQAPGSYRAALHNEAGLPYGYVESLRQAGEEVEDQLAEISDDDDEESADALATGIDSEEAQVEAFWQDVGDDYDLDEEAVDLIRELIPDPWEHPLNNAREDWLERRLFAGSEYEREDSSEEDTDQDSAADSDDLDDDSEEDIEGIDDGMDDFERDTEQRPEHFMYIDENGEIRIEHQYRDHDLNDNPEQSQRVAYYERLYDLNEDDVQLLIEMFPNPLDHPLELLDDEDEDSLERKLFASTTSDTDRKQLLLAQTATLIDARDAMRRFDRKGYAEFFG